MDTRILKAYNVIMKSRQNYGVFHKSLFHIHTPASHDFRFYENQTPNYYYDLTLEAIFQIAVNEGLFQSEIFYSHDDLPLDDAFLCKKEYITYLLIAHKLFVNRVEIAVISDHNNINGFDKLKRAIDVYNQGKSNAIYTHIFLGVEISCADKNHVVGIFDSSKKNIENLIRKWLNDNIMSDTDGTFRTSYDVLSEISSTSLAGVGYIAHIDTSDAFKKGFLSQAYREKLFSNYHTAIGVSNIDKIIEITKRINEFNHEQTAYFWECDAHSIDALNDKAFWIKGQSINFNMLKNAIRDFEIAIQYNEPKEPKQSLLGMVIHDGTKNFLTDNPKNKSQERMFKTQFSDSLN